MSAIPASLIPFNDKLSDVYIPTRRRIRVEPTNKSSTILDFAIQPVSTAISFRDGFVVFKVVASNATHSAVVAKDIYKHINSVTIDNIAEINSTGLMHQIDLLYNATDNSTGSKTVMLVGADNASVAYFMLPLVMIHDIFKNDRFFVSNPFHIRITLSEALNTGLTAVTITCECIKFDDFQLPQDLYDRVRYSFNNSRVMFHNPIIMTASGTGDGNVSYNYSNPTQSFDRLFVSCLNSSGVRITGNIAARVVLAGRELGSTDECSAEEHAMDTMAALNIVSNPAFCNDTVRYQTDLIGFLGYQLGLESGMDEPGESVSTGVNTSSGNQMITLSVRATGLSQIAVIGLSQSFLIYNAEAGKYTVQL